MWAEKMLLRDYYKRHSFLEGDMEMNGERFGMRGPHFEIIPIQLSQSLLKHLLKLQFHLMPPSPFACKNAFFP